MIVLIVSIIILKFFVDTKHRIESSCTLSFTKFGSTIVSRHCLTKLVPGTANASKYHLELVLSKVMISI